MPTTYPNYYDVLGAAPDADREAIRKQYLQQMQAARAHPDLGGDHAHAALLNEAYLVLRDPQRRAAYDRIYLRLIAPQITAQIPAAAAPTEDERRKQFRRPYHGMVLLMHHDGPGIGGQCRDLSTDGCSLRTLRPLQPHESVTLVFQDDPGLSLVGEVRWRRILPQRFGPPLFEGGIRFRGVNAERFEEFLGRIGTT